MAIQYTDEWEPHTKCLVRHLAGSNDLFVNVGAHYGFYTCFAASMGMDVIAVEPIDQNFKMLRDNVAENGFSEQCLLIHGAAGTKHGLEKIYGAFSGATLEKEFSNKPHSMFQITQLLMLDDINMPDVDKLVLMDVEFFEYQVLMGASKLLANPQKTKWVIELIYDKDRHSNYHKTLTLMNDHGYQAVVETAGGFSMIDLNEALDGGDITAVNGNVLFIHKSDTQTIDKVCNLTV